MGLAGVTVDTTSVSKVMPETNSLTYRGYAVQDLAANCRFEEVAYLMWHGELPTRSQLRKFEKDERSRRNISRSHVEVIRQYPETRPSDGHSAHLRQLSRNHGNRLGGEPADKDLDRAMNMLAKIPTMIATDYRFRKGMKRIAPRKDLTMSENFFHMCFGKVPPREVIRAFDISLILYAEHSFNASTFTREVITSSRSDIYSAVTGGIDLKGPLHGGRTKRNAQFDRYQNAGACREMAARQTGQQGTRHGFRPPGLQAGDSRVPTTCALPSKTLRLGRATPSGWRSQTFSKTS